VSLWCCQVGLGSRGEGTKRRVTAWACADMFMNFTRVLMESKSVASKGAADWRKKSLPPVMNIYVQKR